MSVDLLEAVAARMRALVEGLEGASAPLLREMLSYHLGWEAEATPPGASATGKLVRPRLCLLSCQAVGGEPTAAVAAAAAVELIHNFSLLHDDIEDRDEWRRGRPTVWKRWGEAQAINAGDCMYSLAYASLTEGVEAQGPRLRAVAMLARACVRLCEGQAHDLALQERPQVSRGEYLEMIERKTGELMSCAAAIGALLGGAEEEVVEAFRRFGCDLGLAFQVRDDLLGTWGDPDKTGKPVGADLVRRRCSYPVVFALEAGEEGQREAIRAAQRSRSPAAIAAALAVMERLGARQQAEALAARLHQRAWQALAPVALEAGAARGLRELTDFLGMRER